jgi:hypothetical protein
MALTPKYKNPNTPNTEKNKTVNHSSQQGSTSQTSYSEIITPMHGDKHAQINYKI